jgi:hypothetical protein
MVDSSVHSMVELMAVLKVENLGDYWVVMLVA